VAETVQQLLRERAEDDRAGLRYDDHTWTWREHVAEDQELSVDFGVDFSEHLEALRERHVDLVSRAAKVVQCSWRLFVALQRMRAQAATAVQLGAAGLRQKMKEGGLLGGLQQQRHNRQHGARRLQAIPTCLLFRCCFGRQRVRGRRQRPQQQRQTCRPRPPPAPDPLPE
jgi:hypothetical protein